MSTWDSCPLCDNELRAELKELGYTVAFRNRKLAGGTKRYITVKTEQSGQWKDLKIIRSKIEKVYPEAYMTSGSVHEATFAATK